MPFEIGSADLVVGIPSFNNAHTIGHVAATAVRGIARHFDGARALVLNSDGQSEDGTPAAMQKAAGEAIAETGGGGRIHAASIHYRGASGKGSAFREIFEAAAALGARAVVVLDADLRSVAPEWIGSLASPLIQDRADYIAPLYRRHKFDGTITNSIVFPLTHALFGGRVRQPIGGDFGFSGALAAEYAKRDVWNTDVARFGIDLWMTTTALAGGFRVAQAHLGAKVHDPKDPGLHLANMLVQVVGTAFSLLEQYASRWTSGTRAPEAPVFGEPRHVALDPVKVDAGRMREQFRFGVDELSSIYTGILPDVLWQHIRLAAHDPSVPFDDITWTRTIFAFAIARYKRKIAREHLLSSLTPLYLGRTAHFIMRNAESTEEEAERQISELATTFSRLQDELLAAWTVGEETAIRRAKEPTP